MYLKRLNLIILHWVCHLIKHFKKMGLKVLLKVFNYVLNVLLKVFNYDSNQTFYRFYQGYDEFEEMSLDFK